MSRCTKNPSVFCSVVRQMSSSTTSSQRKRPEMKAAQTALLICLWGGWNLWRRFTGVRGENQTAWEPNDLRGPWSSPQGAPIKASRRGPHQEKTWWSHWAEKRVFLSIMQELMRFDHWRGRREWSEPAEEHAQCYKFDFLTFLWLLWSTHTVKNHNRI